MNLVDRAKKILLSPITEWEFIKTEQISMGHLFTQYTVILAAIPAIAGFIGRSLIGYSFMGVHSRMPIGSGIFNAVMTYVLSLVGVFIIGYVIDMLAPSFGSRKDINASMKVAVFSYTAAWVAGIFQILPALSWLGIVGLYSFYLLFIGMRSLKEVPQEKMVGYFVVTIVVAIVVWVVMAAIVGVLTWGASPYSM